MIRQFIFISALTITLALTAVSWLIPDTYQKMGAVKAETGHSQLEFHSLRLQQNALPNSEIFQQFLVVNETPKKTLAPKITPIIKPIAQAPIVQAPPPIIPPNFQYIGQMVDPSGVKKIFLSNDGETYVVKAGDILGNRWKISVIQNDQITILDLTNQQFFVLYT
ncbi:hypothetical protein MKL42_02225 [Acinetobacter sp. AOR15_HL]|uniref:hypothetical protein n=1 Tax=unclassified Acinetobacter TaxID=196816 RepID=UPI0022EB89C6|nr:MULTISPECIES: hypothetical protein [unclassified Acinetobacter]MDA3556336.1 hypothetical protein [Acinetobacter sp. AOR15_HL]MDA3571793.1 hypothetical protein [Acinetobacter sp. AOR14_HL]